MSMELVLFYVQMKEYIFTKYDYGEQLPAKQINVSRTFSQILLK